MSFPCCKKFIIGSSFFMTIIPAMYISYGFSKQKYTKESKDAYIKIMIGLSLFYGLIFTLTTSIVSKRVNGVKGYAIAGAISGLIFSIVGRFLLDAPKLIFGIENNEWIVHPIGMVLYSVIFSMLYYVENNIV